MTDKPSHSSPIQGALWGAEAREREALLAGSIWPLWVAMLDATKTGTGTRFFDAGCGSGGASVIAHERGAQVTGLDASESMIAISRERIPTGQFHVGDLEALPFPACTFEATVACNSVHFTSTPVAALRELRRVCAPGGLVAVASLGDPDECETSVLNRAALGALPGPAEGTEFIYPFRLARALDDKMMEAGFKLVGSMKVDCPMEFQDLETGWKAMRSVGLHQAVLRVVGEEKLRDIMLKTLDSYRTKTGSVILKNRFRYVLAIP
jgi:ubiquinone/menaquinone biosynthesis C-methylase UbiE